VRPGTTSAEWAGEDDRCYDFTIVAFNSVGASAPIDFAGDVCPP
jgi:hypothetical protein